MQANKVLQDSILFETESLTKKQFKQRNLFKEKEIRELTDGRTFSVFTIKEFNKMLLKEAEPYCVTFIEEYYDVLRKLTGFKKSEKYPHYKPSIFAVLTLKYVYRRFKIKNLIEELQKRNPYIPNHFVRVYKHFQYLKKEDRAKLIGFIYDVICWGKKCNSLNEFDSKYCKKYGLPTDGNLFK